MQFRFSLWNHGSGRASLHDLVETLACQAVGLGHQISYAQSCLPTLEVGGVVSDHLIEPPGVNVLFESFEDEETVKRLETIAAQGIRFIIIFTETPGIRGFNDRHGRDDELMVERQHYFPRAAAVAAGIGCLVSTAIEYCRRYNSHSHYLEIGYAPLREAKIRTYAIRTFDYAFSGGLGGRRRQIIKDLDDAGLRIVTPERMYGDITERNAVIVRAHGVLGLRDNPKWQIPSSSRFSTALHCGCFVCPEYHDIKTPWRDVLDWPASKTFNSFVDLCRDLAAKPELTYQRQLHRFKTLMAPERTLQPFLELVFGNEAKENPCLSDCHPRGPDVDGVA